MRLRVVVDLARLTARPTFFVLLAAVRFLAVLAVLLVLRVAIGVALVFQKGIMPTAGDVNK
jgi:hypothetical protein